MSYRYMRMLVMFDLPITTLSEKRVYRQFRKFLINEGFIMHQYSIYSKLLLNGSARRLMEERLATHKPPAGLVTILTITEKQFARMIYLTGLADQSVANSDQRLVILGDDLDET